MAAQEQTPEGSYYASVYKVAEASIDRARVVRPGFRWR
jgi:hypothetical protein